MSYHHFYMAPTTYTTTATQFPSLRLPLSPVLTFCSSAIWLILCRHSNSPFIAAVFSSVARVFLTQIAVWLSLFVCFNPELPLQLSFSSPWLPPDPPLPLHFLSLHQFCLIVVLFIWLIVVSPHLCCCIWCFWSAFAKFPLSTPRLARHESWHLAGAAKVLFET